MCCSWTNLMVKCLTICIREPDSSMTPYKKFRYLFYPQIYIYLLNPINLLSSAVKNGRSKNVMKRKMDFTRKFPSLSFIILPKGFVSCLNSPSLFFLFRFFKILSTLSHFPLLAVHKIVTTVKLICSS